MALTCKHSVEVRAPSSQNHPVSSNLYILRHYGHVTQQTLTVRAFNRQPQKDRGRKTGPLKFE